MGMINSAGFDKPIYLLKWMMLSNQDSLGGLGGVLTEYL